jgi:hypothetical protein
MTSYVSRRRPSACPTKIPQVRHQGRPTDTPRTGRHSAAHPGAHAKTETKTSPEQAKPGTGRRVSQLKNYSPRVGGCSWLPQGADGWRRCRHGCRRRCQRTFRLAGGKSDQGCRVAWGAGAQSPVIGSGTNEEYGLFSNSRDRTALAVGLFTDVAGLLRPSFVPGRPSDP